MPELDGIEATRRLSAAGARTRVLELTTFDLDEYVHRAMRACASGFVLKGARRAVTANTYSHVLTDEAELDYAELLRAS